MDMIQRLRLPVAGLLIALAGLIAAGAFVGPARIPGDSGAAAGSSSLSPPGSTNRSGSAGSPGSGQATPFPGSTSAPSPSPTTAAEAPSGSLSGLAIRPYRPIGPSATVETRRALSAELARLQKKLRLPGVSAAILFPDGTVWTGTSGLADVGAGIPVAPDTSFSLASVSKTFTAAAIMSLVEDGALSLDQPVAGLLPVEVADRRITVRMLLDHTSGLFDFFLDRPIDKALQGAPTARWTTAQTLRHVKKPYFAPGNGWHYSNTNYLLLGLIVEKVTGRSLAKVIRERFVDPLELETISYQGQEAPRGPLAHGYRVGASGPPEDLWDGSSIAPFTSVVTASAGAGSVAGSALDVARWARAVYGGHVFRPETLASMVAPAAVNAARKGGLPYGLGVQVYPVLGRQSLGHSGRFLGFQSVVRHLPGDDLTIAVLTNQSRTDPAAVLRALLEIAAPDRPACVSCPEWR